MSTYDKSIEDMTESQLDKDIIIYSGYIQEYSDYVQDLRDEKGRRAEQKVHRLTQDIRRLKEIIDELGLETSSEADNDYGTPASSQAFPHYKRNRKIKTGKLTGAKTPVLKRNVPSSGETSSSTKETSNHTTRKFIGLLDHFRNHLFVGDIVRLKTLSDIGPLAGQTMATVVSGDKVSGRVKISHIQKPSSTTNRTASNLSKQN